MGLWLRLGKDKTIILGENQDAMPLSKDRVKRQRCKHIDIKYHSVRDALHNEIEIVYCPNIDMIADVMYGIHIFSSLKISNKNILKNILEI